MNNESFDIQKQRDAPTKDCKGKAKVHYSSSSRKLKTKRSYWFFLSYYRFLSSVNPFLFLNFVGPTKNSWYFFPMKSGAIPSMEFFPLLWLTLYWYSAQVGQCCKSLNSFQYNIQAWIVSYPRPKSHNFCLAS